MLVMPRPLWNLVPSQPHHDSKGVICTSSRELSWETQETQERSCVNKPATSELEDFGSYLDQTLYLPAGENEALRWERTTETGQGPGSPLPALVSHHIASTTSQDASAPEVASGKGISPLKEIIGSE